MSSLDEILEQAFLGYRAGEQMDSTDNNLADCKAQIKAWALEIIPKFSDMPSFNADQMDGFRQACLKMEAKLEES